MSVDFELILEKQVPNLLYLIRFRLISQWLQVDNLVHAVLVEDVVAAFSGFAGEACALQEVAEVGEGDVRVGASGEDFREDFPGFAHELKIGRRGLCKGVGNTLLLIGMPHTLPR